MAIRIKFSIQDVIDEFQLDAKQVQTIADNTASALTLEIHRQWTESAKNKLHKTREGYINGLLMADVGIGAKSITLVGKLNNMIENGVSAFDLKDGFEKSSKVVFNKKGGWYLTIPFRWATPGAGGFSSAFTGVMPTEIYDIVKNFSGKQTTQGNSKVNSQPIDRLGSGRIPVEFVAPNKREKIETTSSSGVKKVFDEYIHKSSFFEGMQRDEKFYEKTGQSTYNTFRRVGKNSDPMSWIHKGIQQFNLAKDAVSNTDAQTIVDNEVDRTLSSMGFGD